MTHVNLVCAFACPLPLWPERVVACRVSVLIVSSGCIKLLLVESGFPDLFFLTISLGFARIFYELVQASPLMFLVVQILFNFANNLPLRIFCAMSKSALLLATILRTSSQMHAARSSSTVIDHTQTHKIPFLFQ